MNKNKVIVDGLRRIRRQKRNNSVKGVLSWLKFLNKIKNHEKRRPQD